jgi:GNAT superfamily N-acetyltransferase
MSYEIRWLRDDEWDQCLDLLGEVMDANRGYFSDSFKRDRGRWQSMVVVADGEITSHIRIFDSRRRVGDCLVRSAEIGDVCTHPRHRGHGYMTALLNFAVTQLYLQGFDISTVYSGVFVYEKAGWVAFPEPEQYLLWRLINLKSLLARTSPVFEARAEKLADPYQGVIAISCLGQQGFLEFGPNGCRSLDYSAKPDVHLDLDQLAFFRLLVGRDMPAEMELPGRLGLSKRQAEVLEALFPKARPRF